MNKHAYLILAHNNWQILNECLKLIDDIRNDVFILIDKNTVNFNENSLYRCKYSHVILIDRLPVYWADYSVVAAYISLLKNALIFEKGHQIYYSYFHLQSGTCFPLKSQDYIHTFCDNSGKEFIGIVPETFPYCDDHCNVYWPFVNTGWFRKYKPFKAFSYGLASIQRYIGINRLRNSSYKIYNGWCNCSITHDFALYLIAHENTIYSLFHKSLSPDELWLHTLAYNSEFRDRIYDLSDLRKGSMRYIDWQRGRPYTWGAEESDLETLLNSPFLFARKFDERTNLEIVCKLKQSIETS